MRCMYVVLRVAGVCVVPVSLLICSWICMDCYILMHYVVVVGIAVDVGVALLLLCCIGLYGFILRLFCFDMCCIVCWFDMCCHVLARLFFLWWCCVVLFVMAPC